LKTHATEIITIQPSLRAPSKKFPIQTPNGLRLLLLFELRKEAHSMRKNKLDPEMQQFQADLLQSLRDMKDGQAGRVHHIEILGDPEPAIQQAWTTEAKGRLVAFDRGEIEAAPIEELFSKMRAA
jgi:hypothetical protein